MKPCYTHIYVYLFLSELAEYDDVEEPSHSCAEELISPMPDFDW